MRGARLALAVAVLALPCGRGDAPRADAPSRSTVGATSGWPAGRGIVWRALDHLDAADLQVPRAVAGYSALARSRVLFNRNPFARHAPPRDRLDLYVTRVVDLGKRAFDLRHVLYLPPPAQARYRVTIPQEAKLRLGLGATAGRVTVRVLVDGHLLWSRPAPHGGWRDEEVDLGAFAGREVALELATDGQGHAFLADPAIFGALPKVGNILLIFVDALATWAVGCYGQRLPVTPRLDELCRQGTRFENAIANGNWTRPSMISFFASWLPGRVGISYNQFFGLDIGPERARFYARAPDMFPALLRRGGYRTAAIVNNLFLQGYHRYGVDVGFEQVTDFRRHVEDTVDISDAAIRFLERHRNDRFFLTLNYNAPHVHYIPPARYAAQIRRVGAGLSPKTAAYLGEVRYTDEEVGRVLRALDRLGLGQDTLVVLTADHGEVHDPHHGYRVVRTGRHSRFGHAVTMYDEEVKVPLIVRQPGVVPAGHRIIPQVRLLDVGPTLLDYAGLPPSPRHQGKSFLNLLRGETEAEERVAFIEGRMMRAVRAEGFKYFWRLPGYEAIARGGQVRRVPEELYDLTRDPREHQNLVGDPAQGERLARLRELGKRIQEQEAVPEAGPGELAAPALAPLRPGGSRLHLRFVGDGKKRRLEGRLRVPGGVRRFLLSDHEEMDAVWREPDGSLRFRLHVEGDEDRLWAEVPAGGEIQLDLSLDGRPGAPLWVGPHGLPLVDPGRISGEDLALLDASGAPPTRPGQEVGVFFWRESLPAGVTPAEAAAGPPPAAAEEPPEEATAADREVEGMLRDWGYLQGEKKSKRSHVERDRSPQ
jgi:arylsulfatase A-like enzyme